MVSFPENYEGLTFASAGLKEGWYTEALAPGLQAMRMETNP
jgi:hypothetical protein